MSYQLESLKQYHRENESIRLSRSVCPGPAGPNPLILGVLSESPGYQLSKFKQCGATAIDPLQHRLAPTSRVQKTKSGPGDSVTGQAVIDKNTGPNLFGKSRTCARMHARTPPKGWGSWGWGLKDCAKANPATPTSLLEIGAGWGQADFCTGKAPVERDSLAPTSNPRQMETSETGLKMVPEQVFRLKSWRFGSWRTIRRCCVAVLNLKRLKFTSCNLSQVGQICPSELPRFDFKLLCKKRERDIGVRVARARGRHLELRRVDF